MFRKRDTSVVDPPRTSADERLDVLERRIKAMELEWDEWFDKFRRLYARLSKRVPDEAEKGSTLPLDGRARRETGQAISVLAERLLRGPTSNSGG